MRYFLVSVLFLSSYAKGDSAEQAVLTPVEALCAGELDSTAHPLLAIAATGSSLHIPFNQFTDVRPATKAVRNKGFFVARWKGEPVFVKKTPLKHEPYHQLPERSWLAIINSFPLGTRLIGSTTFQGEPAIVTDYVDGINEKEASKSADFILTETMKAEMRSAAAIFNSRGIYSNDLQFMFTKDGHAIVIDPEWYYSPTLPPPKKQLPKPMPALNTYNCRADCLVEQKILRLSR